MKKEAKPLLDEYPFEIKDVPLDEILVDKVKTKEGLGTSLTRLGHTTDVVLNEVAMLTEGKKYRVIDGRKTINSLIGKKRKKVHARVFKNLPVDLEKYVLIVRNLQRSHSPIIEAEAFQELIKQGKTQKEISEITGVTPSTISQGLSLLKKLPKPIQEKLRRQEIAPSVAKKITSLPKDVKNKIANEKKITGEVVERYHREYLNSQVSFDDMDLPKEIKGTAVIHNYHVKYGDTEKDMTRKELFSFMEDSLPGLSGKEEIIIKRI